MGTSRCSSHYARLPSVAGFTVCVYIEIPKYCMPYYEVANFVTVTKMNMIDDILCAYGTLRTTTVRIWHQVSDRAAQRSQQLTKSPTDRHRGLSCFKYDYPIHQIPSHPESTSRTAEAFRSPGEGACRIWEHIAFLHGGLDASGST